MRKKIVGMRELDAFLAAISKFVEENDKLLKVVKGSYLAVVANQASGNLDVALATGIVVNTEAPKVFVALVNEFETAARRFLGEARRDCETPIEYFTRIASMTNAEIFRAQARNGITFMPGVST